MNFDYNTMYREYFKIYEDCKRKYSFGEISESEFRKIVISATNEIPFMFFQILIDYI